MIEKRAVVIDDAIAIRPMGYLTLGYDHRLIDGAVADEFMSHLKHTLENWPSGPNAKARARSGPSQPIRVLTMRTVEIRRLGRVAYADGLAMQRTLVEDRQRSRSEATRGAAAPQRALVEERRAERSTTCCSFSSIRHVLTLGVRGDGGRAHILAASDTLARARRRGARGRAGR